MPALELRTASARDHGLYLRFFAQLGTPDAPFDAARWARECPETTAFLFDRDTPVAYAHWESSGGAVHVRHVVVDLPHRGRGLGRALMEQLARRFRAAGIAEWRLNVVTTNAAAIALYEKVGMSRRYATQVLRLPWERAERLPGEGRPIGELPPERDAVHEAEWGLLDGQLARARRRAGVTVLGAEDDRGSNGRPSALAVFDKHFPGSYPFRCRELTSARGLVAGMAQRYDGTSSFVQAVIEDDERLARCLQDAGGECTREIQHMRGKVPWLASTLLAAVAALASSCASDGPPRAARFPLSDARTALFSAPQVLAEARRDAFLARPDAVVIEITAGTSFRAVERAHAMLRDSHLPIGHWLDVGGLEFDAALALGRESLARFPRADALFVSGLEREPCACGAVDCRVPTDAAGLLRSISGFARGAAVVAVWQPGCARKIDAACAIAHDADLAGVAVRLRDADASPGDRDAEWTPWRLALERRRTAMSRPPACVVVLPAVGVEAARFGEWTRAVEARERASWLADFRRGPTR